MARARTTKYLTVVLQGLETAALYVKYRSARKEPASRNTSIEYREYSIKYIHYSGDIKLYSRDHSKALL